MSQYNVQHHSEAPWYVADAAARITYHHPAYPWASAQFSLDEYSSLIMADTADYPVLAAYSAGTLVAAISFTELMEDPHCPGQGSFVMYSVAHQDHPGAAGVLLRELIRRLKLVGASWYQISKRVDALTVLTKYRRLHEQEN